MRRARWLWRASLLLGLLLPSAGRAIMIDFETLPGGGAPTEFTVVGSAYALQGVVFGTEDGNNYGPPVFQQVSGIGNPLSMGVTDSVRHPSSTVGFHILASFATPVNYAAADTFGPSQTQFRTVMVGLDASGSE